MSAQLAPIVEGPRFLAALFALFAAVALLLASAGVYGVSAFETRRLRRELGLRIALGATPWDIRGYVMRLTMRPVICGAAIGAVGARAVAHVAQERLDSIGFASWVPYTVAVLLVVTAAVVAMWWPVRRALRADPATILRT
jgi:ABC-type antimicrobial peptide transport system permease subunit